MKFPFLRAGVVVVLGAAAALRGQNVSLVESGVGVNEVVNISSSGVGNDLNVYAGVLDLTIDGNAAVAFCIDPWHWSGSGAMTYTGESLPLGPDVGSGMGATTAKEIEQLWDKYYSATMSASTSAGLQIAIWELVDQAISAQNSAYWFTYNSANNYGATTMIQWVEANANAPTANLVALTGAGQNYAVLQSSIAAYSPVISSTTSATGTVGQSFTYTITASNQPTSYSATNLPAGLTINSTTGVISGTPTAGGTTDVTISASNAGGTGSTTLALTIYYTLNVVASPAAGGTVTGTGTFAAGSSTPIGATAANGYAFSSWSGSNVSSPNSASTNVTLNANQTVTANFTLLPPVVSNGTASCVAGQAVSYTISATHSPTSYAATSLPSGLAINSSTGVISGTPTTGGTFSIPIQATNAGGTGSGTLTLTVNYTLAIAGSPAAGGTFTGAGTYAAGATVSISQTPASGYRTNGWTGGTSGAVASPGSASTTVTMNANQTLTANFVQQGVLTVAAGTGGTATGSGTFDVGTAAAISATPSANYQFSSWSGSGVVSSTSASTTVTVASGSHTVTANFTMLPPVITSPLTASGIAGQAFSYTITATHSPTSYNATNLPAGLSINTSTGVISGTPTAGGTTNVTISATNAGGTGSATLVVTVDYTLSIAASPSAGGTVTGAGTYAAGSTVSISETAASGYRTNGWAGGTNGAVAAPGNASTTVTMNANQTLTANFVAQGTLTVAASVGGTASGGGTFDNGTAAPISATPSSGYTFLNWSGNNVVSAGSSSTSVTINGNETVTANFHQNPPVITSPLTASGVNGQSFGYTITATNNPTSFSASGLPAGLSVNTTSGVISGTPTVGGTFDVTISASNSGGTGSATVVVTIYNVLTITASPAAGGTFTGAGNYAAGSTVTITETAANGYRTNGWAGPNVSQVGSPTAASTTITLNGNCTLVANFVQQGTLTVVAGTGGTVTGGGTFDVGTSAPIGATANSGYAFSTWSGSNVTAPSSASTSVTVQGNETVTANFAMLPPVITSPLTLGDNLNEATTSYTITATNNPTSFNATGLPTGLTVNTASGAITGTPTEAGSFNVTISASNAGGTGTAVLALTVSQTYTLTITGSPAAGGTFTGAGIYAPGAVVNITETPAGGYRTAGWGGAGVGAVSSASSASTTVTMNADCVLTADFVQQGVVTVTAENGGTATGSGTFDVGTAAPIVATAGTGYVFTGWTGSSDISNAESASTTVNVTGAESLVANFLAAANPEQLGTIIFPNAVPPGVPGYSATTSSMNAVVTNSGSNTVTISNLTTTGNFTPTVNLPITLAPGASQSIPVTFAPQVLGLQTGLLTGVSSDTSNPVFQFVLEGTGVNPSSPPSATITAASTAYTGSPFYVASTAFAPDNNLTQHSIEWMSPEGVWNVDTINVSGGNSSRTLGITFTETGTWTLRAGASVDGGQTWYYSPSVQVAVSNGLSNYVVQSMAIPSGTGSQIWYSPSPVVQQTYQVLHTNPTNPGQ